MRTEPIDDKVTDLAGGTVHHEVARVIGAAGDRVRVATASGTYEADVALSCVFRPAEGDEVVLAVPPRGAVYVASILRRVSDEDLELVSDRAVTWVLARGLSLVSGESIDLAAAKNVSMRGREIEARAERGRFFFEALESVAGSVLSEAKRVRRVIGAIDSVIDRVSERIGRAQRTVEGLDAVRAGQLDLRAEGVLSARARHSVVSAEELVKIDGSQIHLG